MTEFQNLFLTLTRKCNLTCRHCYIEGSPHESDEIGTEQLLTLIDELAELKLQNLRIDGGEALLHPDIYQVIDYAHARGLPPSISTNGLLVNEHSLAKMNGKIRKIIFSVDGATADTHNWMRAHGASFDAVINAIKLTKQFGIRIDINYVVTNRNIREVDEMALLAHHLGVDRLTFFSFSHLGRALDMLDEAYVDAKTQYTYINHIESLKEKYDWVFFEPAWAPKGSKYLSDVELMCVSQDHHTLFVDPKGDVYKCSFFLGSDHCLGNINEMSFKEIYRQKVSIAPGEECSHGCPALHCRQGQPHDMGPGHEFEPICFLAVM